MAWIAGIYGGWLSRRRKLVCHCGMYGFLLLLPIAYSTAVVVGDSLTYRVGTVHQPKPVGACRVACHPDCPVCQHQPKTPAAFFYWFYPAHLAVIAMAKATIGIY